MQGAGGPAEVVRGLRGRATARQPPRGRAQPGFGHGTGEPGGEGGEDRRRRCAGGQCRHTAPGECGVQRVQRNARVTQGRGRHVEQRGQNPGKEPQPARRDARPPLERVRRGVRPGDEQLRAGPDEVHAAVGQHVDHLGRGRRRRGPHALGEPAPPKRHGVLAVAHGTDGSAHAERDAPMHRKRRSVHPTADRRPQKVATRGGKGGDSRGAAPERANAASGTSDVPNAAFAAAGSLGAPGAGQDWRRTASISRATWTFSLTTTPPPSSGMEMSTPKSLRLIVVVAEKPARVPP